MKEVPGITKVDKEYPDNHLTGAVFEIYTDTDGNSELGEEDTLLGELTEYEGGIYRMDGLRYGKYLVKEKTAPEGFLLDENVYAFAVTEDGQCQIIENEAGIGFADQVMKGKISIFKTDKATGEKLVGAGFRVCDPDGNVVAEGKTGEDGMVSLIRYTDQSYYDTHPVMYLTVADRQYMIEIFSGYATTADSSAYMINCGSKNEFARWLKEICEKSDFKADAMEISTSDRVVTLSTCAYNFQDARYVVHGRLKDISS